MMGTVTWQVFAEDTNDQSNKNSIVLQTPKNIKM
jgi:hypothetical protein